MGTIILSIISPPGEAVPHHLASRICLICAPNIRWLLLATALSHLFHHHLQSGSLPTTLCALREPFSCIKHSCVQKVCQSTGPGAWYPAGAQRTYFCLVSDDNMRYTEQCSCCYVVNLFVANNIRKRVARTKLSALKFSVGQRLVVSFVPTLSEPYCTPE